MTLAFKLEFYHVLGKNELIRWHYKYAAEHDNEMYVSDKKSELGFNCVISMLPGGRKRE